MARDWRTQYARSFTIEDLDSLRAAADRQKVSDDARRSRTPASKRNWTYATATATAELAANARALGLAGR